MRLEVVDLVVRAAEREVEVMVEARVRDLLPANCAGDLSALLILQYENAAYEDGAYGAYGAHGKLSSVSVPCDVIRRLSVQVFLPHPGCLDCAHATAMG